LTDQNFNVLFLCTGNSARSIIAESLIDGLGGGRFKGYSAGSHPAGEVNPLALWVLEKNGFHTAGLRSKNWDEFSSPHAPRMDFVFTVCDRAAAEVCPVWPGQPVSAHWGTPDPATVEGADIDRRAAFCRAFDELQNRISIFVDLPFDSLDRPGLERRLVEIGETQPNT